MAVSWDDTTKTPSRRIAESRRRAADMLDRGNAPGRPARAQAAIPAGVPAAFAAL